MTMFAIMNVFIVPIILYEGIKIGLYPEKGAGSIIGGFTHNIIEILEMRKNYSNIQGVGFQPGGLVLLLCIWGFFFVYNFVRIDRDKRKAATVKVMLTGIHSENIIQYLFIQKVQRNRR